MTKRELAPWGHNYRATSFLAHSGMTIPRSEIKYLLRRSTKVQLASFDDAIKILDSDAQQPEIAYERRVIKEIIRKANDNAEEMAVLANLTLRDAFTSEWSRSNVDPAESGALIRTLVNGYSSRGEGHPHIQITTALVRFAYEVTLSFSSNESMVPDHPMQIKDSMTGAVKMIGRTYKDYDLHMLVMSQSDDVGRVIALAVKHATLDPEVLGRLLLAPDTALPLNSGIL